MVPRKRSDNLSGGGVPCRVESSLGPSERGPNTGVHMGKKKRISEMTPEEQAEQRRIWAEDQAQRREEKRKAAYIPTAEEWRDEFAATEHHKTLNVHVKQFLAKVEEELGHKVGSVRVKTGHGPYEYFDD